MSHLFDEHIAKAFHAPIEHAAERGLTRHVAGVLSQTGMDQILDATLARDVEEFAVTELGVPPELTFRDEFAFFDNYVQLAYEVGSGSQSAGWCSKWWAHRSVRFRIRSMWLAWEAQSRTDPATCDEYFLRIIGDHHMAVLTGDKSPMASCTPTHKDSKPLPSDLVEGDL